MIRKFFFRSFFKPKLCSKINTIKYPWGWKSQEQIKYIIDYPFNDKVSRIEPNRKEIHEYKLINYTEDVYKKTYYAYFNNYDFLNSNLFCPKLSNGLNFLKLNSNLNNFNQNLKIQDVKLLGTWIKYGKVTNQTKLFGVYDTTDFVHEITTGIIGPEYQSIWDQQAIKQKARLLVISEERSDVLEFERNLMIYNDDNWQLCNINRIIV
tara:strand:- start:32061 stop:32684 length:624 start_codon:yes stop_codon:yes gene_type:complete